MSWLHTASGYRYTTIREDGRRRIIAEHRQIMERHLGRRLDRSLVVHHVNGDRTDNRIENLEVLDRAAHNRKHHQESGFTERVIAAAHAGLERVTGVPVSTPALRARARVMKAQGRTPEQIAAELGYAVATVKSWFYNRKKYRHDE